MGRWSASASTADRRPTAALPFSVHLPLRAAVVRRLTPRGAAGRSGLGRQWAGRGRAGVER
ncbi:hypothetical protein KCH_18250 [Kitasatospora cheerisanensis KCTC 2395]|uniref:Uncharacterized protein n=1 Tax=Kitasatospora cheerisanensis KCTC 2395 TaxID=1348663 RepID=A0A066YWT6_9ACTN|nr:hypothetical protein KCH_18250 [Kitasatospora cheerisanensis KCTC 2395]